MKNKRVNSRTAHRSLAHCEHWVNIHLIVIVIQESNMRLAQEQFRHAHGQARDTGHWYEKRGTAGTLHSPLRTLQCLAHAWVRLTKNAVSKVERVILFYFLKTAEHNSCGNWKLGLQFIQCSARWRKVSGAECLRSSLLLEGWICLLQE